MEWGPYETLSGRISSDKGKVCRKDRTLSRLEIDYLNEEAIRLLPDFRELPLDYRIGSVHMLYNERGEVVDGCDEPGRW